jgi:HAD superfamily hydrolase (TIGR01509 family)
MEAVLAGFARVGSEQVAVAILDVDGTLVDTNYQHALAWYRAFRACGVVLPIWRIHRHIGMGGDQLVGALAGERFERERGERAREVEQERYGELIGEVELMEGARELLVRLRERGHTIVLASSAKPLELDRYLEMLDGRSLADDWTSSQDVQATKPEPDLVHAALRRAGCEPAQAVMVGDSPWDAQAAARAGVRTIGVLTGGFAREELLEAGAEQVYESVGGLCAALGESALR